MMVHARVSDKYIHLSLMYTIDNIFSVIPIKNMENKDSEITTPNKLATGTKPSVSNLRVLFFPCVVLKSTLHVDTKSLNMCHRSQKMGGLIFNSTTSKKVPHLRT